MKARIVDGLEWGGNHSLEWLYNNQNIVFAGQLVSEWELTEVLPNVDLKNKIWDGIVWIEGITSEEVNADLMQKANTIDEEYSKKIFDYLYSERVLEKYISEQLSIPQFILDEKQRLRQECDDKIAELGIDVPIYRKTIKETI